MPNAYQPGWELDKDILKPGNKIYSPKRCCFVPNALNLLMNLYRATGLPPGVQLRHGSYKKSPYTSTCFIRGRRRYLGVFSTPLKAFRVYKEAKEAEIARVAKEYRATLDARIYRALLNYEIRMEQV